MLSPRHQKISLTYSWDILRDIKIYSRDIKKNFLFLFFALWADRTKKKNHWYARETSKIYSRDILNEQVHWALQKKNIADHWRIEHYERWTLWAMNKKEKSLICSRDILRDIKNLLARHQKNFFLRWTFKKKYHWLQKKTRLNCKFILQ